MLNHKYNCRIIIKLFYKAEDEKNKLLYITKTIKQLLALQKISMLVLGLEYIQ